MGMDVMEELLERAKTEVSGCEFVKGNICNLKTLPNLRFDAIFMNGVHSIFDDIDSWLGNAISLVNSNGKLFVFGIFNPVNVDVLVKAKYSDQNDDAPWQSGWNCFSTKTVKNYLKEKNLKSYSFHDFNISIDIPRNENDPLRSWTFKYSDNSRGVINGTMILHKFMLLDISI
jgi:ubiquinone/menaquinone biosynthesis C-methylase UbiE